MKVWVVAARDDSDPQQRIYLMGAHSTPDLAQKQQQQMKGPAGHSAHVIEMEIDGNQPPVVIGVDRGKVSQDCQRDPQFE